MSTSHAPEQHPPAPHAQPEPSGPGEFLVRWLTLRRPARLVVDGLIVLALSGVLYTVWILLAYPDGAYAPPPQPSPLQRNLTMLASGAHYALWYLGVVLVVFGCVRQLGGAVAAGRSDARVG